MVGAGFRKQTGACGGLLLWLIGMGCSGWFLATTIGEQAAFRTTASPISRSCATLAISSIKITGSKTMSLR
jgi:hypothetical protein